MQSNFLIECLIEHVLLSSTKCAVDQNLSFNRYNIFLMVDSAEAAWWIPTSFFPPSRDVIAVFQHKSQCCDVVTGTSCVSMVGRSSVELCLERFWTSPSYAIRRIILLNRRSIPRIKKYFVAEKTKTENNQFLLRFARKRYV